MKICKYTIIYFLTSIFTITSIIFVPEKVFDAYLSIVAVFQLLFSVWLLRRTGEKLFSFTVLFVSLSFVFHFGQQWVIALNRSDLIELLNISLADSFVQYKYSNFYALLVVMCLVVGMSLRRYKPFSIDIKKQNITTKNVFSLGLILLSISVVPQCLYYYKQIGFALSGGAYLGIRQQFDLGPIMLLTTFFNPSLFMLLIGSKDNKKRANVIFICSVVFEIFCMLSGNRAQQIIMIITLIFIYHRCINEISVKKVLFSIFPGYLLLSFMYSVSAVRHYGIGHLFDKGIVGVFRADALLSLLSQLGSNLNVVILSLKDIPSVHHFNYGLTYVVSFFSVYPNTGGWLGDIPNMYAFLNYYDTSYTLGGSYIAELFFNFGWLSLPIACLIGYILRCFSYKLEKNFAQNNYLIVVVELVAFTQLLWWVRDYFYTWIFPTVWSYVVIFTFRRILLNKNHS